VLVVEGVRLRRLLLLLTMECSWLLEMDRLLW